MSALAWFTLGVTAGVLVTGSLVVVIGLSHLRDDDCEDEGDAVRDSSPF